MKTRYTDWRAAYALMGTVALTLAGCGDDGGGADTDASTGAASTSGTPTTDAPTTNPPTTDTTTTDTPTTAADSSSGEPDPSTTSGDSSSGEPEGTSSSTGGDGSSSSSSTGDESSSSSTGEAAMIMLTTTFTTYLGDPLPAGSMLCSVDGCEDIINSAAVIEVLADADIDVWVVATDFPENHYQFSTGPIDEDWALISPSQAELELVAGIFGVTVEAGMGHVAHRVATGEALVPSIDDPGAEGPFYLSLVGAPSKTFPNPDGFYLFFNVAPGPRAISLPGCDEGSRFWGVDSDESIDIDLTGDGTSLLVNLTCG